MLSYCFLETSLPFYLPYFYVINMADEEACEKKIRQYGIFINTSHVDKERRKLKTYYL